MPADQARFLALGCAAVAALLADLRPGLDAEPVACAICGRIAAGLLVAGCGFLLLAQADLSRVPAAAPGAPVVAAAFAGAR
ncbi:hypothetical protein [uncultured Methylobacterium sp.]|uniref:hypothetical protein n=1 Tax=uncultured Methylobacterium sp. TaxID=157278 RepID=UPI0035CBC799